jgi:hypothetical protein
MGYATVGEIRSTYRFSVGYIYRKASEAKWRRYTLDGRVRYHREDVADTFTPGWRGEPA